MKSAYLCLAFVLACSGVSCGCVAYVYDYSPANHNRPHDPKNLPDLAPLQAPLEPINQIVFWDHQQHPTFTSQSFWFYRQEQIDGRPVAKNKGEKDRQLIATLYKPKLKAGQTPNRNVIIILPGMSTNIGAIPIAEMIARHHTVIRLHSNFQALSTHSVRAGFKAWNQYKYETLDVIEQQLSRDFVTDMKKRCDNDTRKLRRVLTQEIVGNAITNEIVPPVLQYITDLRRLMTVFDTDARFGGKAEIFHIIGISQGGWMGALLAAVEKERIGALIPVIAFADISEVVTGATFSLLQQLCDLRFLLFVRMWMTTAEARILLARNMRVIDPITYAAHLDPKRIVMVNGRQDMVIPYSAVESAWEAYGRPKRVIFPHLGHLTTIASTFWKYWVEKRIAPDGTVTTELLLGEEPYFNRIIRQHIYPLFKQ